MHALDLPSGRVSQNPAGEELIGLLWTIFGDLGELKNQHVIDTMMSSRRFS